MTTDDVAWVLADCCGRLPQGPAHEGHDRVLAADEWTSLCDHVAAANLRRPWMSPDDLDPSSGHRWPVMA